MASQVEQIKWVPGTTFLVDGFQYINPKCTAYFLTHFHSDHTVGLRKSFEAGPIYCSPVTAALVTKDLGVSAQYVHVLPLHKPTLIQGVVVTLLDANHCPGSAMVLFQVPQKEGKPQNILHTGDCRWQAWMCDQPVLRDVQIDTLFLDTTYALPRHSFPPQQTAIELMVRAMQGARAEEPATLFVMAAYHIGKERAFFGAAKALGCKVWCNAAKRKVLKLLDLPADHMELLADSEEEAGLHVVHMGLKPETLQPLLESGRWKQVVGIRPTGWTYRRNGLQVWREGAVVLYGVPYSEHSSWHELCDCVRRLRPTRIVPTVNAANPQASRAIVDRFASLMDLSRDPSRLDMYFARLPPKPCGTVVAAAAASLQPSGGMDNCVNAVVSDCPGMAGSDEHDADCEDERDPDDLPWQVDRRFASIQLSSAEQCHARNGNNACCSTSEALAAGAAATSGSALRARQDSSTGSALRARQDSGTEATDMDAVDVQEQQRIWDAIQRENERVRRLQQSVATAKAAAVAKRANKRRPVVPLDPQDTEPWDEAGDAEGGSALDVATPLAGVHVLPGQSATQWPGSGGKVQKAKQPKRRRASATYNQGASHPRRPAAISGSLIGPSSQVAPPSVVPSSPSHPQPMTSSSPSSSNNPSSGTHQRPPSLVGVMAVAAAVAKPSAGSPWSLPALAAVGQRTIHAMFSKLTSSAGS